MRTYSPKPSDIKRQWYILDASEATLGRVSAQAASLLTGKGKASFSHHLDGGDYVVIINASQLKVTGNKLTGKKYYRHSGYPSGLTTKTLEEAMQEPESVIRHAIRGMLPVNKLRPARLERLKIYPDAEHKHTAQSPQTVSVAESRKR